MRIQTTFAAALALAAITAATPSFARTTHTDAVAARHVVPSQGYGYAYDDQAAGHFAPGFTGYGRQAYNPEQPTDPDPRIGGALKMSTDR
jgi:hypothetical protein